MKLEMDLSGKKLAMMAVLVIIGIAIGYGLAMTSGTAGMASPGGTQTLTTADLNRSDIQASILLSRFCEGMGLQSGVYWQQDAQGNVFGAPICLPPPQQ
jgi:MFS-type transporter involved in bile tolerance (Atg22 family)